MQTGGLRIECGLRRPGPALALHTHECGCESETLVSESRAAFPGWTRAAGVAYGPMKPASGGWGALPPGTTDQKCCAYARVYAFKLKLR